MPMDRETYEALGLHLPFPPMPKKSGSETWVIPEGDKQYNPCAEAYPDEDIPTEDVFHIKDWSDSRVFPDSTRDIYIYTPPNLGATEAPNLAFFNDGAAYLNPKGPVRAAQVMDSMIHSGDIPPTVGVFVNPSDERSFEYDSVTPSFVTFINEEIIPLVEDHIGCTLNPNPAQRLIGGHSSGGICAFNAAWHSPESFGRVLSHCGSYTNIRGGHNFPYLVRSTEPKPIKVLLQSGEHDLNIIMGSWPIANQDMAAALKFAHYDYKFIFGEG
ncbi:MAG TPA: hypothetical protein DCM54_05170, partial [Gammaproteobacteria bacterium]|nr:hypothetical protein [Gammaproteobacteria bacterium]